MGGVEEGVGACLLGTGGSGRESGERMGGSAGLAVAVSSWSPIAASSGLDPSSLLSLALKNGWSSSMLPVEEGSLLLVFAVSLPVASPPMRLSLVDSSAASIFSSGEDLGLPFPLTPAVGAGPLDRLGFFVLLMMIVVLYKKEVAINVIPFAFMQS